MENKEKIENNNSIPLESKKIFSKIFLTYPYKIIKSYKKKGLNKYSLFRLKKSLLFKYNFPKFLKYFKKKKKKLSFFKISINFIFKLWLKSFILFFIYNFIGVAIPFLIRELINWFVEQNPDTKYGYIYCLILFAIIITKSLCLQHALKLSHEKGVKMHHIIFGIIFQKFKNISLKNIKYINSGQIASTLTIDIHRITGAIRTSHQLFIAPLMVIVNSCLIIYVIGWVGILGVCVVVSLGFVSFLLTRYSSRILAKKMVFTDERNKEVGNCVNGIKSIKYNAWESIILRLIENIRSIEKKFIFKILAIQVYDNLFSFINPILATFLSISIKKLNGDKISLGDTYLILMLYNMFVLPMRVFFFSYLNFLDSRIIFNRINHITNFGNIEENEKFNYNDDIPLGEIRIENGTFFYDYQKTKDYVEEFENLLMNKKTKKKIKKETKIKPILKNINLSLKQGEFIAIIGKVGSGKTSLLKAITKTMFKKTGSVKKNGIIGYIPQTAFLMNETIKQNIIFGKKIQKQKFEKIIKICELEDDLKMLPGGIDTEIGERGINLSGGQKQRINIARAVYADADIYLIDDSLSALDSSVGQKIFNNVFKDFLGGKSKILVTHSLQYLEDVDRVILVNDGEIIIEGNYHELIENNDIFKKFCNELKKEKKPELDINESFSLLHKKKTVKKKTNLKIKKETTEDKDTIKLETEIIGDKDTIKLGALSKKEKIIKGVMDFKSLQLYAKRGGYIIFFIFFLLFFLVQFLRFSIDFWIGSWSSEKYDLKDKTYFYIYLSLIISIIIFSFFACYFYSKFAADASYEIFFKLINLILKKKITYFDITPIGQILNLTSKDTDFLDFQFPNVLHNSIAILIRYFLTFILMIISTFLILPFLLVYFVIAYFVLRIFIKISVELRRLEQIAYSPIISNIKELYDGIIIIRNFDKIEYINEIFTKNIDTVCSLYYHDYSLQVFVVLILELLNGFIVIFTFIFFVTGKVLKWEFVVKDPNVIALSLNYMFMLVLMFNIVAYFLIETIKSFTSLQRMFKNVDNSLLERNYDDPKPPLDWPQNGNIEAKNVYIKYQDHLPNVLNGLNFDIKKGEKIGIVGRTGSGKSTLLLALTRIIELNKESNENYISIDNIKINKIGLKYLRKMIKVVPQDPFLMKGSLRFNIDPFNNFKDEEVIEVLKKCLIWDSDFLELTRDVIDLNDNKRKLNYNIEDQGKNLSNGQRQLICLGRTLIENPKFILMDEATSSIDPNSDLKIQKIIKNEFNESTIITIAHRLNTVIYYDRIFVLDQGKIIEKGTPIELIMRKDSIFRELIEENGNEFKKKMIECAKNKDIIVFDK